jgi:diguanylate cyclase (GGDEF)-like protein
LIDGIDGAPIKRARRYRHPLNVIYLDPDNFKSVNDRDGDDAGDRLLRTIAKTLSNACCGACIGASIELSALATE